MSRSKKGAKPVGWDYWGKRPIGMGDHGTKGKRAGIQIERAQGKRETPKPLARDQPSFANDPHSCPCCPWGCPDPTDVDYYE